jgi:hypothetical protein
LTIKEIELTEFVDEYVCGDALQKMSRKILALDDNFLSCLQVYLAEKHSDLTFSQGILLITRIRGYSKNETPL